MKTGMSSGSEAQFGLGDSVLTVLRGLTNNDLEITRIIHNHIFFRFSVFFLGGNLPAVKRTMLVHILEAALL